MVDWDKESDNEKNSDDDLLDNALDDLLGEDKPTKGAVSSVFSNSNDELKPTNKALTSIQRNRSSSLGSSRMNIK